jgi:urea transporter
MHFLRRLARVTLVSYAQVLLTSRPLSGLFFLAASFATVPFIGLVGLVATLSANLTGYWTYRERIRWDLGLAGYNAVMLGLTFGYFLPFHWWVIVAAAAAGAVSALVTDFLYRRLVRFSLPVLGLPFLAIAWLVIAVATGFHIPAGKPALSLLQLPVSGFLATFLHDMGSAYFSASVLSGILVLAGLLFASRISAGIGLAGALAGVALNLWHPITVSESINLVIAPVGLAFFLAPNRWLPLHVLGGLALTLLATLGLDPVFKAISVPMLILPLTLTIFAFLLLGKSRALGIELVPMRLLHSPEFNFRVYRNRLRSTLHLPFFGTWFVSQGVDGGLTHKGRLSHAWDFMVRDERGRTFATPGYRLTDYHAFGLLVSAPAAGRVVALENDVPDNVPGKLNEKQNWGNWLIIEHNLLEYSILAHLRQGSIRVKFGDHVAAGTVLGACGNSGYSGQPHLHYQLQTNSLPGSDTLESRFGNYLVLDPAGERFVHQGVPKEGETIQPLVAQDEIRRLLAEWFEVQVAIQFMVSGDTIPNRSGSGHVPGRTETWQKTPERSGVLLRDGAAQVLLREEPEGIQVVRIHGRRNSLLYRTFDGLEFIPFYSRSGLRFESRGWSHRFGQRERLPQEQGAREQMSEGARNGNSECKMQSAKCKLRSADSGLLTTDYSLLTTQLDALVLESQGKGAHRRVWFVQGIGVVRIEGEDGHGRYGAQRRTHGASF